jgi:hypothetical protein
MKGRQKNRRFFKAIESKKIQPNIYFYQDFESDQKFKNATALGSLITVEAHEVNKIKVDNESLFGGQQQELKNLYNLLGQRYDVVVTNPPYINSSRMEGSLKQYVEANYPETKTDLFATFILKCFELCNEDGLTGFMTPFVWMFISSYEKLREIIIDKHFINNLIQLEYSGFDGATVPICTFTFRNKHIVGAKGTYIRLSDFKGAQNQAPKTLEAINNPNCGWFYVTNQNDFKRIPNLKLGYWLKSETISVFDKKLLWQDYADFKFGMSTANNSKFIRTWQEISIKDFKKFEGNKWFPANNGGEFRRWYGNKEDVLLWENNGLEVSKGGGTIRNKQYYFRRGITWTSISSSTISVRSFDEDFVFTSAGFCAFCNDENTTLKLLAFLNSKVALTFLKVYSPTLNFNVGDIQMLPDVKGDISIDIVNKAISISRIDWDLRETSWDFQKNELIRNKLESLTESLDLFKQYWRNKFFQLHNNEEELNRQFIEIYGLQDELTPDVPLEEITILKEETSIKNGDLVFHEDKVLTQFVSYAVGCMFGRYSLDKEGLILANQGEALKDYLTKVSKNKEELSFIPDEDNVIPVLDDEWFEDDIVARFHSFLKASFGEKEFQKNLAFVEECLGKDIRKYFVKVFHRTCPTGGNHWNGQISRNFGGQTISKSCFCTVSIHGG